MTSPQAGLEMGSGYMRPEGIRSGPATEPSVSG